MPRVKVPVPQTVPEAHAHNVWAKPQAPEITEPSKRFTTQQLLLGAAAVLFLIMFVMLMTLMSDRNKLQGQVSKLSSPATASKNEIQQLTKEIGVVYELPTGETPTLATVSDASKVRNQAFFKSAQNGDKVLLYSKAGQAILYRPSTKKIIAVAPVNLNGSATSNSGSPTTSGVAPTTK